ncbi:MAG: ABC transporter permease, partial [Acidobacteriia bacterium]|nr:ABC transporter permease [Terriglobia bacterium]
MITIVLGWRNLWRNSRRSLITIGGFSCAFAFLIALVGFGRGLSIQMLRNGTELMAGHIQIHDRQYLPDRILHRTIGGAEGADWQGLIERLRRYPKVRQAAPRVYGSALLSTGDKSSGAQVVGVEPASERGLGRLFTEETAASLAVRGSLVAGEVLALDLGARIGSEVAVVTQASDGTLGNSLFRLTGILRTGLPQLDRSLAVIRLDDAMELLALPPGRIHEIAVKVDNPMDAPAVARDLASRAALPAEAQALSWRELLPQLSSYVEQIDAVNRFIVGLVVLFASMGVLNTMMMATFERVREFGVLNAIGMGPGAITGAVLVESFLLASLGLAGGLGLGWVLMQYLMTHGMNLARWTGEAATPYITAMTAIAFTKMHGLGNDFVVIDLRGHPLAIGEAAARA